MTKQLQDRFGRRFKYLRLSITDVCNFRCNYCLPDGYQCDNDRDFLSLQEIQTVVNAFAALGTSKIRITGGEPSLRKDLCEIIRLCRQTAGINEVAITTNGFKLSSQIEQWIDAGLTQLNVSIDSLEPHLFKTITGHDKLQEILHGIDLALTRNIPVKVNAVLLKSFNPNALSQFLDWIKQTPVTLRFIELMQTGDNLQFFQENHIDGLSIKGQLLSQGWTQTVKAKTAGPAQEFIHPEYAGKMGLIMPYSKDFCQSCNRLRISALGLLHLCLFAEQGIDLRPAMQSQDSTLLQEQLISLLEDKQASHWLQDGYTGATKHLAMLGG
jgi:cyclic pyranopterin phosphate synthase